MQLESELGDHIMYQVYLRFRPRGVGAVEIRGGFRTGDGALPLPGAAELPPIVGPLSSLGGAGSTDSSQRALSHWDWSFHAVRGGVDPRGLGFRSRVVGVVDVWKDQVPWTGSYPPPDTDSTHEPQPCSDKPVTLGFPYRHGIDPGERSFRPRVVRVVDIWIFFLIPAWDSILTGWRWLYM